MLKLKAFVLIFPLIGFVVASTQWAFMDAACMSALTAIWRGICVGVVCVVGAALLLVLYGMFRKGLDLAEEAKRRKREKRRKR